MANYNAIAKDTVLGFKAGSQADLNKYLPGGEQAGQLAATNKGVFFLTTDTHRLYLGRESSEDGKIYPVPVNQGILSVKNIEDLTDDMGNTGEFYYIEGPNILCIKSGGKWVQINPDTDTKITGFSASTEVTTPNKSAKIVHTITTDEKDGQGSNKTHSSEFTIKGGDNVSVTVNGEEITISTPNDKNTTNTDLTVTTPDDGTTGYKIVITDSDQGTVDATLDPEIQYGKSTQKSSGKFENGVLTLDVYTTNEVDNLLKTADALVFRGIIEDYSKLPSDNVQNGDTYKVGTEFTHEGTTYKVGDIIIAHGTETNDYLTKPDWIHIPAGDEVYKSGNVITVSDEDGTINHNTLTPNKTESTETEFSFDVISSITPDAYGHIGAYEITTVTVPQLAWDTF